MWPPRWYYSLPHATKGSIWGKRTRLFLRGRFLAKGPICRGRPYRGSQEKHKIYEATSGSTYRLSVFEPGAPGGRCAHIVNVCSTAHSTPSLPYPRHIPGNAHAEGQAQPWEKARSNRRGGWQRPCWPVLPDTDAAQHRTWLLGSPFCAAQVGLGVDLSAGSVSTTCVLMLPALRLRPRRRHIAGAGLPGRLVHASEKTSRAYLGRVRMNFSSRT